MKEKFLTFIQEHCRVNENDKVMVAVSGGIDSVALTHLLHQSKIEFALAHCNFGLRGEESDMDEEFVKKLSKKYKVPFYVQHFQTQEFADTEKISIQMAARALRYKWFDELLQTEGYSFLATAHHQNDLAETILLNITKGTGIAGLHGILPKNGKIIRPILYLNKDDIYEIVLQNQLTWREDSSNESIKYQRNLIRHEVVPVLKQINPNFENTLAQSAEKIGAVERWFLDQVEILRASILKEIDGNIWISINTIKSIKEPKIILYELLKPYGFNYDQIENILQVLESEPGKQFESPTSILIKDRNDLIISKKSLELFQAGLIYESQEEYTSELIRLRLKVVDIEKFKMDTNPGMACLDYDKINFPIQVRKWKPGDWFIPLGMNKKKKISDFLTDDKIPLTIKDKTLVLSSAGSIIWVAGKRVDNRYKVTDSTTKVLLIQIQK